jgi:hypothetical protein
MKLKALLPALALLALVACNGGARHIATVSVVSAHATLSAVQDTADAITCGAATAPQPPKCLDAGQRKAVAAKLSPAFGYDEKLAKVVRDWPQGIPPPAEIGQFLQEITALLNQALAAFPQGPQKDQLLVKIGGK